MIEQAAIFVLTPLAIALTTSRRTGPRTAGAWVGLVGQGFWIWATWSPETWGMGAVALFIAAVYFRMLWKR